MRSVAVVGGGPVGLALALMLRRVGIDCEVVDARPAGAARSDRRVLALSHGSRQILERLGAWQMIGATPIDTIHVSQQGSLGRTLIRAQEAGVPALGYVAEAGALGMALSQAAMAAAVPIRHGMRVTGTEAGANHALLRCTTAQGSKEMQAQLIAWAEGGIDDGDGVVRRDYGQQAIVARVQTREPGEGVAYERFTATGPVALLPLGKGHALVWTVPEDDAASLLALDDGDFLARLNGVFSGRLAFTAADERTAFPLGLRYRQSPVAERSVWLGNAAQTLHPVAGQGFNLALRDASQLVRMLQNRPADCGDAALLTSHAAARRMDRRSTINFTDGLVRFFGLRNSTAGHARGAGLLALDLLPAARRFFARRMIFGTRGW
ncbi:MAG: FAD-dependent monooxygenase [Rhodocyclaceae bacterium]|nr:FAD-dependent monooxygenase [Rhodocyclaceae bacterium]